MFLLSKECSSMNLTVSYCWVVFVSNQAKILREIWTVRSGSLEGSLLTSSVSTAALTNRSPSQYSSTNERARW